MKHCWIEQYPTNMRLRLMYPHVTTYKLWADLDENNTSTNAKYQSASMQICRSCYIRKEWLSMTFRPVHLYSGLLDVGFHPERNTMSAATEEISHQRWHKPTNSLTLTWRVKMVGLLPAEPRRWLSGTWTVCCRWAGGRQMRRSSEASASPHKPAKQRPYNECHQD